MSDIEISAHLIALLDALGSDSDLEAVAGGALHLYSPSIGQYHEPTGLPSHTDYWAD